MKLDIITYEVNLGEEKKMSWMVTWGTLILTGGVRGEVTQKKLQ